MSLLWGDFGLTFVPVLHNNSLTAMLRFLLPTDFSENASHALRVAAALANKAKAKLELVHINTAVAYSPPLPEYYGGDLYDSTEYYETAARELHNLKKELTEKPELNGLDIETRIEEGFLFSSVRRIAEEDKVDLVVMGTKGASGVNEFFIGSNTEKVIRTAPCAVLTVPEKSGDFDPKVVVIPTTLRKDQKPVFDWAARLQQHYPLKVKVLYLNNPADLEDDKEIEKTVQEFASASGLKDVETFGSTSTFNEEFAILSFAQEQKADLIAMVTHQRRGLSHLLFGSLTEDAANHSDIPVLSVPA